MRNYLRQHARTIIFSARVISFVPLVNVLLATPYFLWIGAGDPQIVGMIQTWFYFLVSIPIMIGFGGFQSRGILTYGIIWNILFLIKILGFSYGLNPIPTQYIHPLYCFSSEAVRMFFLTTYITTIILYSISLLILKKVVPNKIPCN